MQRAGKFGMLANSCKDLDRSGSKRYEKLCAWSCFQRVGDLLVLQLVFPGGVNQFFSFVLAILLFFPLFIWSIILTSFYSWGGSPPHVSGVDVDFNRWLKSYSRCEWK